MTVLEGFSTALFAGRRVVITGAAGGIGRALASAFDACGASLILIDRVTLPRAAYAASTQFIACDLGDRAALPDVLGRVAEAGPLAALINCAGVFHREAIRESGAEATWDRTLAINLTAPYLLSRGLADALSTEQGTIVNVTSVRAETAAENAAAYTASKGGLAALTIALAAELAPEGIRVNAIAPGDVATKMSMDDPAITSALVARTPLRRMARPEEIAAAAVFLASPLSAFTTGATLRIDGGFLTT